MSKIFHSHNEALESVWLSMGEHFLDTETRQGIPRTAMNCVDAGLSVDEAREVWCYEVSPVLAFNLWDIAGEWAGWPEGWLVESIRAQRTRGRKCGLTAWLCYRLRVHFNHSVWVSIERCMAALLAEEGEARELMSSDLSFLAGHCFDFCADDAAGLADTEFVRLKKLYPDRFWHIMKPALVGGEEKDAKARLEAVFPERM